MRRPRTKALARGGRDLASFAVVVPSWTLVVPLVVGLIIGGLVGRLSARHASPAVAGTVPPGSRRPEPGSLAVEAAAAAAEAAASEPLAAGAEDVVAELERRYQGRRANGEADKPATNHGT